MEMITNDSFRGSRNLRKISYLPKHEKEIKKLKNRGNQEVRNKMQQTTEKNKILLVNRTRKSREYKYNTKF